jgi:hypothetical protein
MRSFYSDGIDPVIGTGNDQSIPRLIAGKQNTGHFFLVTYAIFHQGIKNLQVMVSASISNFVSFVV